MLVSQWDLLYNNHNQLYHFSPLCIFPLFTHRFSHCLHVSFSTIVYTSVFPLLTRQFFHNCLYIGFPIVYTSVFPQLFIHRFSHCLHVSFSTIVYTSVFPLFTRQFFHNCLYIGFPIVYTSVFPQLFIHKYCLYITCIQYLSYCRRLCFNYCFYSYLSAPAGNFSRGLIPSIVSLIFFPLLSPPPLPRLILSQFNKAIKSKDSLCFADNF